MNLARYASVFLVLSLSMGAAQALTSFTYDSGSYQEYRDNEPASNDYRILFADPFLGYETGDGSAVFGGLEVAVDMGTVGYSWTGGGDVVSYTVQVELSNNTTSRLIRFEHIVNCSRGGYCDVIQDVYVQNGSSWDYLWREIQADYSPFSGYHYLSSSIIAYANNSRGYTEQVYQGCEEGGRCIINPDLDSLQEFVTSGEIWWVRPHHGSRLFADFDETQGYGFLINGYSFHHLANLSGVVQVDINTYYHNRLPSSMVMKTAWYTQGIKESHREADECEGVGSFKSLIKQVLGFCPTVDSLVSAMVTISTLPLAFILALVPGGDLVIQGLRGVAVEILGAYFLTLTLVLTAPAKFVVVGVILSVGGGMCFAGYNQDIRLVGSGIKLGITGTFMFVFWLFYALLYFARWSWNVGQWAVSTVVHAIRG